MCMKVWGRTVNAIAEVRLSITAFVSFVTPKFMFTARVMDENNSQGK